MASRHISLITDNDLASKSHTLSSIYAETNSSIFDDYNHASFALAFFFTT